MSLIVKYNWIDTESLVFIAGILFIPYVLIFLKKQLFKRKVLLYLFIFSLFLSIVELIHIIYFSKKNPDFYLTLFCPFFDIIILLPFLWLFRRIKKRDPKDVPRQFIPFNDGLWVDRFFEMTLLIFWLIIPIGLFMFIKY